MSEVVRLTLISHAMTDAMAAVRFPADEPLNALGHRQIGAMTALGNGELAICAPEIRARQTAELLGLAVEIDPRIADLDCGRWRGGILNGLPAEQLSVWLTAPEQAPHGGESIVDLIARVRAWLDSLSVRPGRVVAVTHPAVIRAVMLITLDAPPISFWRIDIAPASRTTVFLRGNAWTFRSTEF